MYTVTGTWWSSTFAGSCFVPSLHAEDRAGHLTSAREPGWFGSVGSGSDDNYCV